MPCTSPLDNTPHQSTKIFENWAGRIDFTAQDAYRPSSRGEIVQLIAQAEETNRRIKWVGSLWSMTRNLVADDIVVETDSISGQISSSLILEKLSLSDSYTIEQLAQVKGGTKIYNVNRILHGLAPAPSGGMADENSLDLDDSSKAMPTLGGAGGQSLAGLIATGTHGGDVHLPPIADSVAAIHLIGPGGQEWWIERASDPLTRGSQDATTQSLREAAKVLETDDNLPFELCSDVIARKDDDLFNSVLVAVGRMGFIYSFVIKTVDGFKLEENRTVEVWENYLRDNLISQRFEAFLIERETAIGQQLRFLQVLINPFRRRDGTHECKVAERHVVDSGDENVNMENSGFDISAFMCGLRDTRIILPVLVAIEVALNLSFTGLINSALAVAAIFPPFSWVGAAILYAAAAALVPVIVAVGALILTLTLNINRGMTSGELMALISNFAFRFGYGRLVGTVLSLLFNASYPTGPAQRKLGVGWKIMDTYGYATENYCQKVDAVDFAFDVFDTTEGGYIRFISRILDIFDEMIVRKVAIAGLLTLRYTRRTSSKLGMSRFYITCHVEIPLLRGFAGNSEFLLRARALASQAGGVPGWGQMMDGYNAADIENIYGEDLTVWRQSLRYLIDWNDANDSTFSNDFTSLLNLEPL